MVSWSDFERAEPELAGRARAAFDRHIHKTMATLRRDGSPRISGTEVELLDGEMWIGSMYQARKAQDLQRDPRIAIHSASAEPDESSGGMEPDAKVSGRAIEVTEATDPDAFAKAAEKAPPGPFHLFRIDITEVVVSGTAGDPPDHMLIEHWTPTDGLRRYERQ